MANVDNETQKSSDKFRRAETLIVDHLNLNPQDEDAPKIFTLWKRKLELYLQTLEANNEEKFNILTNQLGFNAYEYIDTATTYTEATTKLERIYSKTVNKIYARWKLTQEKQREGESMDTFVNRLMILEKDCNFADVTAIEYKKE